jgi:hypothetical protein
MMALVIRVFICLKGEFSHRKIRRFNFVFSREIFPDFRPARKLSPAAAPHEVTSSISEKGISGLNSKFRASGFQKGIRHAPRDIT